MFYFGKGLSWRFLLYIKPRLTSDDLLIFTTTKYILFYVFSVCQAVASSDCNEAVAMQQYAYHLQDPEKCLDLLFMYEYSQILTHAFQQSQDTGHLPPTRKIEIDLLIAQLEEAKQAYIYLKLPENTLISWTEKV